MFSARVLALATLLTLGAAAPGPEPPSSHQQNSAVQAAAAAAAVHHQTAQADTSYGAPSVVSSAYGAPSGSSHGVQDYGAPVSSTVEQYEVKDVHGRNPGWPIEASHKGISGWTALLLLIVVPILLLPFFDFLWFAALSFLSKGHHYGPPGWGPAVLGQQGPGAFGGWGHGGGHGGPWGPHGRSLQEKIDDLGAKILPKLN